MVRPERVVLRRLRRLLRPPVAMRLHVGRSDEGDPADDLARGRHKLILSSHGRDCDCESL